VGELQRPADPGNYIALHDATLSGSGVAGARGRDTAAQPAASARFTPIRRAGHRTFDAVEVLLWEGDAEPRAGGRGRPAFGRAVAATGPAARRDPPGRRDPVLLAAPTSRIGHKNRNSYRGRRLLAEAGPLFTRCDRQETTAHLAALRAAHRPQTALRRNWTGQPALTKEQVNRRT